MTTLCLVKIFRRSFSKVLLFAVSFLSFALSSFALSSSVLAQPFAYVTHEKSNDVWVIDTKTDEVVAKVEVGQRPRGVVISPDNTLVYIANGNSNDVSVIDAATNKVAPRPRVPGPAGSPHR